MSTRITKKAISTIEEIKLKARPVFSTFGVQKAGLFGSTVRGQANRSSDVDIVVQFADQANASDIFHIVRLKDRLKEVIGKDIDLSMYSNLRKRLRPFILAEQVIIYDEKE